MALAARGARDLDDGPEALTDSTVAAALRARARGIWLRTGAASLAGAVALWLLG